MNLADYPIAISNIQKKLLKLEKNIRKLEEFLASAYSAIDREIAFNSELKNEAQRKAKRQELIAGSTEIVTSGIDLQNLKDKQASLEIDLQLLRNQFSILKLEKREAIALLEVQAAS